MRNFQTYSNDVSSFSLHNRLLYSSGIVSHALKEAAMGGLCPALLQAGAGPVGDADRSCHRHFNYLGWYQRPTDWRLVRPFALAHWPPPPVNDWRCYSNGCGFCHAVRATRQCAERPRPAVYLAADQHTAGTHSSDLFYGALPGPGCRDYRGLSRTHTAGCGAHQKWPGLSGTLVSATAMIFLFKEENGLDGRFLIDNYHFFGWVNGPARHTV